MYVNGKYLWNVQKDHHRRECKYYEETKHIYINNDKTQSVLRRSTIKQVHLILPYDFISFSLCI